MAARGDSVMAYLRKSRLLAPPRGTSEHNDGQSMVEYALFLAFTTLVCIAAVTAVGVTSKEQLWDVISEVIGGALGG